MTEKEIYSLMIWCGALHDIAEKTSEDTTRAQIARVQNNIERLIETAGHYTKLWYDGKHQFLNT